MEFLGIGPLEFLLIIVIALIVFSPKDLSKGGRELGRLINRIYKSDTWKSMRQVSQEMQNLPSRLAREAQLEELKNLEKDLNLDTAPPRNGRRPAGALPPAGGELKKTAPIPADDGPESEAASTSRPSGAAIPTAEENPKAAIPPSQESGPQSGLSAEKEGRGES
jgi:Sec-independent protein translocase protein TatA